MLIPIIIPTGYSCSCTVEGSTFRIVQCEHCRFVYVYKMTRKAAGTGTQSSLSADNSQAADHAELVASMRLNAKLQFDCDAIPCLECGKYQQHMVEALRHDHLWVLHYGAWSFYVLGIIAGVFSFCMASAIGPLLWLGGAAATFLSIGKALQYCRARWCARFDPNKADLAERMQIAQRYARTLEEFQAYLKMHGVEWELPKVEVDEGQKTPDHRVQRLSE